MPKLTSEWPSTKLQILSFEGYRHRVNVDVHRIQSSTEDLGLGTLEVIFDTALFLVAKIALLSDEVRAKTLSRDYVC